MYSTWKKQHYSVCFGLQAPMNQEAPACIHYDGKNLYKVHDGRGKWAIYTAKDHKTFYAIAKEETGCLSTYYGDMHYIKTLIKHHDLGKSGFTKLGYTICF